MGASLWPEFPALEKRSLPDFKPSDCLPWPLWYGLELLGLLLPEKLLELGLDLFVPAG